MSPRRGPKGYIPVVKFNGRSAVDLYNLNLHLIERGLEKYSPEEVFGEDEMELPDDRNMEGDFDY